MPRSPNFNEADVRDKPQDVFERPRLSAETIEGVQENWQQELESLLSVDEAVAKIIGELENDGRLEDTLIVFVSDNGFMHGEHRIPVEKVWPYDESSRVPLILRGPGVPEGLKLDQLAGNIDVVPTILDAAGATANLPQDGRSLFELMEDPTLEWGREILIQDGFGANGVGSYWALRNYRYLLVQWRHSGEYELYDLHRDPWALRNLHGKPAYQDDEAELRRRLRTLRGCWGRSCSRPPALRLAGRPGCENAMQVVRVRGRELAKVGHVDFFRGGRRLDRDRSAPFQFEMQSARRIRARAVLRYGRVVTLDRRRPAAPCP
jgi:arylsulfatase A-like enzyme